MSAPRFYVTTAIPYVNGAPHLGHALEFVQADVLARHRRLRGQPVRFLSGTDDNALKNVTAAKAAGRPVGEFVAENSRRFSDLAPTLRLSFDDFIRTSSDPRHRRGVEALWRRCERRGDFYRRRYEGLYCAGCEQFYTADDLVGGCCAEHGTPAEPVAEENWFFRLTRYRPEITAAIESGRVLVQPFTKRNEVLGFLRSGLTDLSVSRPASRADGWGIAVPGDPSQVIYVWWDALANYVSALGYGADTGDYQRWWAGGGHRVHVIGKGITRFHAVYWLALLLSAGLPLPTDILVHDYLTLDGSKLSKSAGRTADPADLAARYGADAVRWWLLRDVPRVGDADFTTDRLVARSNTDLANGIGNLVHRTITLVHQSRAGQVQHPDTTAAGDDALAVAVQHLRPRVDRHLADFDFRGATDTVWAVVQEANKLINRERPWELARREATGDTIARDRLTGLLDGLIRTCRAVAHELQPFIPDGAGELLRQLGDGATVGPPTPVFHRL